MRMRNSLQETCIIDIDQMIRVFLSVVVEGRIFVIFLC